MQGRHTGMRIVLPIALLGLASLFPLTHRAHTAEQELPEQELPELLWTCPMHPDVLKGERGICPICKMDLEPTRLDAAYSCPNHRVIIRDGPGTCPIDRRELVPVTVALHWTCVEQPSEHFMEPGVCPNGEPRRLVRELRAHGDHNPRHGGQFFMAADNWHHLEGTYPHPGFFRVWIYDNFTQPIDVNAFSGRAVTREGPFNPEKRSSPEIEAYELRPSKDGTSLETEIANDGLPQKITLKLRFNKETSEQRFDFVFTEYSVEPMLAPATTTAVRPQAPPAPSATNRAGSTAPAEPSPAPARPEIPTLTSCDPDLNRTDVLLASDALPRAPKDLLNLLEMCSEEVEKLIEAGQFAYVYQPTMLGKDIALALENSLADLPNRQRMLASDAIRRIVLVAWQLDLYSDLGNQQKSRETFKLFVGAVEDVTSAYGKE